MDRLYTEQLVNGLKNKESESLKIMMDLYSQRLKRTVYLIIRDENLAEDIVQDTFIKAFYHIEQFKGNSSIYTYLYKIALNECRQKMRKKWFKKTVLFDKWLKFQDNTNNFEDEKANELTISHCISRLATKYREVILLYYYEDMSIKDICNITGEKEGTIKNRLKRARDKIKPYLKEAGFHYE